MKEFNYKRAWEEYVRLEYLKLSETVLNVLEETQKVVDSLTQNKSLALTGQTPELVARYDAIPVEELAWASKVIYYYGHLSPYRTCQMGGLYWKFAKLADASVLARDGNTVLNDAEERMSARLKDYNDHKPGTDYDNEELPGYLSETVPAVLEQLEILRADYVNHNPHPFVIGAKHFPKDGGMFINPHQAGCAHCGRPYEEHTSERALFVRPKTEDETLLKQALQAIIEACKGASIKLDGFALVR